MRAKQLEIIKVANNPGMNKGVNTLIYNLAFSPKIKHINLAMMAGTDADTAEALYKLIKISGAIETLILEKSSVINGLTLDFYKALGENKTLKYLNIDMISCTNMQVNIPNLAKCIAMNAKKNGSLESISMSNWFSDNYVWHTIFLEGLKISDYDHEIWYGDQKLAASMEKDQFEKKMFCSLKYMNIKSSSIMGFQFHPKEILKQSNLKWPGFLEFASI